MNKLTGIIFLALTITFSFAAILPAQENDVNEAEIIITQMRLPFPASRDKKPRCYSLDDEVAMAITEAKRELGLYYLTVGVYIDSSGQIADTCYDDCDILYFNEVTWFKEAIVILGSEIFQQGVSQQDDEVFFSLGNDDRQQAFVDSSKNVRTQLLTYALLVDIETGQSLGSLELEVFYTGGSAKKSKSQALKRLKEQAKQELKRIYWFSAEVIRTKKGLPGIPHGTRSHITKGLVFELVEPDRFWKQGEEELLLPGGSAAFAMVVDTSADSSGFRILRQWRDSHPGSWAVELPQSIYALELTLASLATDGYTNLGVLFHAHPMHDLDWGLGIQLMQVTDSFGDDDFGFGFNTFGQWRWLNTAKIDLGGKIGLDLEFPYRKDDDNFTVYTLLFSAQIGMVAEFLLSQKFDFVINAGYRFGAKSDRWEYSEDDDTYPAYWDAEAPEVDNSGLMFSVGFKYLLF